jgi:histone-binding protein RBBP4
MSDTAAHPSAGVSKKPRQEDEADREPENEDVSAPPSLPQACHKPAPRPPDRTHLHPTRKNNGAAEEDALIEEEHLVWRKNAPFLYDFVLTEELEWPSLSVQWLAPDTEGPHPEPGHTQHKLLVGTNAEPGEKNYIAIYQALLPDDDAEIEPDLDKTKTRSRFRAVCRIPHDGDVNRVRAQPGNENIIASRMADGAVGIFNTSKFGEWGLYAKQERFKDQPCDPLVRGVSHSQEGYGLDWDPLNSGRLLTCGDDAKPRPWCSWR